MIKRIKDFFTHGIWQKDKDDYSSGSRWWLVRQAKVILFTLKSSDRHSTAMRSAALTYYTLLSVIPILAIAFAIAKGFGMDATLTQLLYNQFPDYHSMIDTIMGLAGNLLSRTRGGIMAISAFFVLIFAVIRVFGNVESAFNAIWEVKNTRSFARRLGVYLGVVIIAPILMVLSYTILVGLRSKLLDVFSFGLGIEIMLEILSAAAVIGLFILVYMVIPNTKVKFKSALWASLIAGTVFYLFQMLYFAIQGRLGSYNAIYGAFAAIPLFLIWISTSWQILLYGAELAFSVQNVNSYEEEQLSLGVSYDNRCKIMLAVMVIILREFMDGKEGLASSESLAKELRLPIRIVRDIIHELERDGLVLFVTSPDNDKVNNYVPAADPRSLRFLDVIATVTGKGTKLKSGHEESPMMKKVGSIYDKVKEGLVDLPENVYLVDLIN